MCAPKETKAMQRHRANNLVLQDGEKGSHAWILNFTAEHLGEKLPGWKYGGSFIWLMISVTLLL